MCFLRHKLRNVSWIWRSGYIGFAEKDHIIAINRANLKECDNSAKIVSKSLVL